MNLLLQVPRITVIKDIIMNPFMKKSMLPILLMKMVVSNPSSSKFDGISISLSVKLYIA